MSGFNATPRQVSIVGIAFLVAFPLAAQVTWVAEQQPVLDSGAGGAWSSLSVVMPHVLASDGGFQMWYLGYSSIQQPLQGGIGHATSLDGVIWDVDSDPVIAHLPNGSWEGIWTFEPWVLYDNANSTYRMWYAGADENRCQIGYADSPDGLVWGKHVGNPVLRLDGAVWEEECIDGPSVLIDGATFKMWYSGGGSARDNTGLWSIGYATSLDGIQWQKYADNPVISEDSSGRSIFSPCVILDRRTGTYEMWYTTTDDAIQTASISYATSADGVTWCEYPGNPVFLANGMWESPAVMHPVVLLDDSGTYKMWYTGRGPANGAIGLATSEWTIPKASFAAGPLRWAIWTVYVDATASATPNPPIVSYEWDFGDGSAVVRVQNDPRASHFYALPGHYTIKLTVTDSAGMRGAVARGVDALVGCQAPLPWTATNLGEPLGGACLEGSAGCLRISASGRLLASLSDQVVLVHKEAIPGDIVLTARIDEVRPTARTDGWEVGVMLRESLEPGSRHLAMLVDGDYETGLIRFGARARRMTNASTESTTGEAAAPPQAWVRVARQGDVFIASYSTDGNNWNELQRSTLENSPRSVFAGVVATASYGTRGEGLFTGLFQTRVCDIAVDTVGFHRGDPDSSGKTDLSDAVAIFGYLFLGSDTPSCLESADVNNDGTIDISDGIALLNWLFAGGTEPAAPGPSGAPCGVDSDPPGSAGDLGCEEYPPCR